MPDAVDRAEENVEVYREIIALMKKNADELRKKGLPIDDMIRDLEQKVETVVALAKEVHDLAAEDEFLTKKREHLRKEVDALAAGLPPDLRDGMATIAYLQEAAKREAKRRRRGRRGIGG